MKKISSSCIIDDDQIFVYGTRRIMKDANFCETIHVFENGLDAINALKKMIVDGIELPRLIFLDLNMPIMDGWEFLEDFLKIPNNIREQVTIFIISSSIDPRDIERVKEYDVVSDYILKPVTPKDLRNLIEEIE
ncbi:response regulator [Cellulophaga sp. F20128]|uniref:response regulator n=1 Tax=Cellulophaga sp. F20128 TaxID=2926413 RepID=UPI001FF32AED|nr:response regulator [Cellulophaga sp. F20128]MCK0157439.1 response regulator [Cellulophaga sp. F20128]